MSLGRLYDKLTFQVLRHPERQQTSLVATFNTLEVVANQMATKAILQEVSNRVVDLMTKDWLEVNGPAVLEQLTPGSVANAIRTKLEQDIAKKVLG